MRFTLGSYAAAIMQFGQNSQLLKLLCTYLFSVFVIWALGVQLMVVAQSKLWMPIILIACLILRLWESNVNDLHSFLVVSIVWMSSIGYVFDWRMEWQIIPLPTVYGLCTGYLLGILFSARKTFFSW